MREERGSGSSLPLWLIDRRLERAGTLTGDRAAEVAVIGAGVAGLTTAYLLAQAGVDVIVLDDGPVAGGETSRTTAHLSNALDDRYTMVERLRGEEVARVAAEAHTSAIRAIGHIVEDEGIDCRYTRLPGHLFAGEGQSSDRLVEELEACRRAGLRTEWLDESPLAGWPGPCLLFPDQAQIDPLPYLNGLRAAIEARGGRVHSGVHVNRVEEGQPAQLITGDGPVITAGSVVVATNSPVVDLFAMHTKLYPYRTFAVALALPRGAVPAGLYWDDLDPYHYVRLADLGGEQVLVVGGEDHKTGQADDAEERWSRLVDWARERFQVAGPLRARWSGQVLETLDGLAYIGRDPAGPENVFIATGDSGMGMTHGTIAGLLLADLVRGRENRWQEAFEPSRKPLRAAGEYLRENLNVAAQYADWIRSGEDALATLERGSGAIVELDGRRVAAYRDDDGEVHQCSPVCVHLQCMVRWNSAERSWDCPCHGSRFDGLGRVLNGPANRDLEPPARPRQGGEEVGDRPSRR